MISYRDSVQTFAQMPAAIFGTETRPLEECLGRVLAEDFSAPFSSPRFTNSAMDGFAFRHGDVGEKKTLRVLGKRFADKQVAAIDYVQGSCLHIMTGAPVPSWADTVVAVEKTTFLAEDVIQLAEVPESGVNIRRVGEDIQEHGVILKAGTLLTAERLMIAAFFGIAKLPVQKHPEILVFSTGDEIQDIGRNPSECGVYDSSKYFLKASLKQYGLAPSTQTHLEDNELTAQKKIAPALEKTSGPTLILTTGGVSAGEKDFIPAIAKRLGFTEVFHRVAVRPGKPIFFATKGDNCWLGLPGNPISTVTGWHFFARQLLAYWAHFPLPYIETYTLTCDINKPLELSCFLRGKIIDREKITPFAKQGSAHLFASTQADGYVVVFDGQSVVKAGTSVDVLRI